MISKQVTQTIALQILISVASSYSVHFLSTIPFHWLFKPDRYYDDDGGFRLLIYPGARGSK